MSSYLYFFVRRRFVFERVRIRLHFVTVRPGQTSPGCLGPLRSGPRRTDGLRFTSVRAEPRSTGPCAPPGPRAPSHVHCNPKGVFEQVRSRLHFSSAPSHVHVVSIIYGLDKLWATCFVLLFIEVLFYKVCRFVVLF